MNPADRIDFATGVIREAGAEALSLFDRLDELTTEQKGAQDVVSQADRDIEIMIRTALSKRFPDDAILGEESGLSGGRNDVRWIVDPIDGTQCFLDNVPCWCVSIGLTWQGRLCGGLIYDPLHDELFATTGMDGATCNGFRMRPSSATDFSLGMVEVGWSTRVPPDSAIGVITELLNTGGIYHRGGSGALGLAYVADGRYIAYCEGHMQVWDSCAGAALVQAAGGWVNDILAGDGIDSGSMVIACGQPLAPAFEKLLKSAGWTYGDG